MCLFVLPRVHMDDLCECAYWCKGNASSIFPDMSERNFTFVSLSVTVLQLWSLEIFFGSPDLSEREPINSLSYVRASVSPFRSYSLDRSIFFSNFLHEVVSPYDLDDHQKIFRSKNFLIPKMAKNGQNLAIFGQNSHFWVFLAYIFQAPL